MLGIGGAFNISDGQNLDLLSDNGLKYRCTGKSSVLRQVAH
jgi:hypothetical protein